MTWILKFLSTCLACLQGCVKANERQRHTKCTNVDYLSQSSERGSFTPWLAIKKSTTGPGFMIMVVGTSGDSRREIA